jgi:predicted ATPase
LSRVGNLPIDVTSFVGRRREVAEVKQLLTASRLVTLTGVGGVGKTRSAGGRGPVSVSCSSGWTIRAADRR